MATTALPKVHAGLYVQLGNKIRLSNLCNVLRGDFQLPATGETDFPPEFGKGHTACSTCERRLRELSYSLNLLAAAGRSPEQLAAEEREFAKRRWQWSQGSFRKGLQDVADRYARMADETLSLIAREFPEELTAEQARDRAFKLVNRLHHDFMWMAANLSLDTLGASAVELDDLARQASGGK